MHLFLNCFNVGLHLITASGEDKNPVIKLWDLRSSTTVPLATLHGHTEGVLSLSWCTHDSSLLLSCGKDNRTILWDLYTMQSVYEVPTHPHRLYTHNNESYEESGEPKSVSGWIVER